MSNFISLAQAKQITSTYRNSKEIILEPKFKGKGVLPVCETFPRDAFDKVLAKPGCVGLRIYFAMDDVNFVKLVIVGVDEKNQDMITDPLAIGKTDDADDIIDNGMRCPDICPPPSPLNS